MLRIERLIKKEGSFCLGPLDLSARAGEYFVLLGPSGAGKTLLLEILAGFKRPDGGRIFLDGRRIDTLPIQKRRIGYLCQGDTLFPHLTVRENISYGLRFHRVPRGTWDEKVEEMAGETGIMHLLNRKTRGLSGGERQRVALARMLVIDPACLILDEPLTGMDEILKQDILGLLLHLHSRGRTFIHVTHDPREATDVASKIAIMEDGRITQEGPPRQLLLRPETEFAARFAGMRNFFPVRVASGRKRGSRERVTVLVRGKDGARPLSAPAYYVDGAGAMFMVLDETRVVVSETGVARPGGNTLEGVVKGISPAYFGKAALIVDAGFEIHASGRGTDRFPPGSRVFLWWPDEAMKFHKKTA